MKKYCAAIFLPILVLLAFVNAGFVPVQKTGAPSSVSIASNASFAADFNYQDSEIEHIAVPGSTVLHGSQGLQKIPGHFSAGIKPFIISSSVAGALTFPGVELFGNNYLSHNYPSHNFW